MRIAFSCVVDGAPKFEWQAFLWAQSLIADAGCSPDELYLYCLPTVSEPFRKLLAAAGANVVDAQPFAGHPYCNKIQQCFGPAFPGYDAAVLCDCDLYFLAMPRFPSDAQVSGKTVDLSNPPLDVLKSIYRARGTSLPKVVRVDCAVSNRETTLCSNLNGGLYCIASQALEAIGKRWHENAAWLLENQYMLRDFHAHLDQVAMGLSLDQLRIEVAPLSCGANFPVHLPPQRLHTIAGGDIAVLHYHSMMPPGVGRIAPTTVAPVDAVIARANASIGRILERVGEDPRFHRWHRSRFPQSRTPVSS